MQTVDDKPVWADYAGHNRTTPAGRPFVCRSCGHFVASGLVDPRDHSTACGVYAREILKVPEMNTKCEELVRFAVKNGWDRDTLLHWMSVTWLNVTGSTNSKVG